MAFAFASRPRVATTVRKLSRYKYGVPNKQEKLGNAPDFVETLCDLDFLCWLDSSLENRDLADPLTLEGRVARALASPADVKRSGIVCLGLSDDAVDDIRLCDVGVGGIWYWLSPDDSGDVELPVWVDHVGSQDTRWRRFRFGPDGRQIDGQPSSACFVRILDPRASRPVS